MANNTTLTKNHEIPVPVMLVVIFLGMSVILGSCPAKEYKYEAPERTYAQICWDNPKRTPDEARWCKKTFEEAWDRFERKNAPYVRVVPN